MIIRYGTHTHFIDITDLVFTKCLTDTELIIPKDDNKRAELFTDPVPNVEKFIYITDDKKNYHVFNSHTEVKITFPSISSQLKAHFNPKKWWNETGKFITDRPTRFNELHKHLQIASGSLKDELTEQFLAFTYIDENSKVLELGGNIGRNTIIIATILSDSKNLVTLESDSNIASQLDFNLKLNGLESHIEASALSKRRLIQRGWDTIPIENNQEIPEGWNPVKSISFTELLDKYKINFDVLVADCEGALYYILKDEPEILDNMNLLILENDYKEIEHKLFIDDIFRKKGFTRIVAIKGGWGPCEEYFYEVWKK